MKSFIRILHLEDDQTDEELVRAWIEEAGLTCQIACVKTRDDFHQALQQNNYDIILGDFQLPMYDGMSALRLSKKLRPEVPFIFVSGTMGEEAAIEGLTEGATDYVLKQKMSRLVPAIQRALHEVENWRERQRAEEALRKLSLAVEQSANTIIITDTKGYIEYANPKFEKTSGYSIEEAIGQHTRILKSNHAHPEEYRQLWKTITAGKEWRGEFLNKKKNGELFWESVSISPIKDSEGVITHFLAVKEDITERKQAEETQKKLEHQLRQAQKMESIGRLAGGVAHDFNNLLTVIQGYCDLMRDKIPAGNSQFETLEQIQRAGDLAAGLTRQLLAFSRQQVIAPNIIDLNELVANLHKMLGRVIGEDITLTIVLMSELWPITADPGQLEQVLMNLVVNARDAMPTGGKLNIETQNIYLDNSFAETHLEMPTGPCVLLTVSDTGHGMDEQTQSHLFEPFFTTKKPGQGTGLGLSTVYGIVKQSGGHIIVGSEPGEGTIFKIYLPATQAESTQIAAPTQLKKESCGGCETILLVEDDKLVHSLIQQVLEKEGYTILEAFAGDEALTLVEKHQGCIDLLLTDVVMPQMSGGELADKLKALHPQMKVLFMSGYTTDMMVQHGVAAAEIDFLPKPFSLNLLTSKVREVLGN